MKKFIYSLVLCAVAAIPAFAQNSLTVYDGGATNNYVPVYGFYADAFNKVEFVMNGEDLSEMQGATLTKMTWYLSTPADAVWGGNFQVYLKEIDATTVSAYDDMAGATLVWEGPLDGTGNTIELEFANDYTYEGGNLLVCVHQTAKGTYKSAAFAGAEVAGAAVQGYNYNSIEQVALNLRDFLPKTTFEYTPGAGVVYYKPKNIQVEAGVNDAVVTWDAGNDETSWNVQYKKAADEEWTDFGNVTERRAELDALANGTPYEVQVQAVYADGMSGWAKGSFQTEVCEDSEKGEVTYTLTDTYGDGWNGSGKLQILVHETGALVAELVLPNASGNYELEGSLMLCYGVDYDLMWVGGTYTYENGFVLYDPAGDEIFSFAGTGSSSGPTLTPGLLTTFQISPVTCPRPTGVVVENITYNSATVSWVPGNPEQDLFEVIYGKGTFAPEAIDMVPVQVNDPFYQMEDLEENSTYTVYVRSNCGDENGISTWTKAVTFETPLRFPLPENFVVTNITAKSAVGEWEGVAETYNLRYREVAGLSESFEEDFTGDGWMAYDTDGDGWGIMPIADYTMSGTPLFAADGTSCLSSCSIDDNNYYVGGDNWIITPQVALNGTLKFYAVDLGADYMENFSVYVAVGEGTNLDDYQLLAEGLSTPGAMPSSADAWQAYEFDLSAFEGQTGRVAIVHNRTGSSGYYLFVDNITIVDENAAEAEWTVVENTTSPTTMEPLLPITRYEAQVQGIYEDGLGAWCDLVRFTTLAADAMPTAVEVTDITGTTAVVNVEGSQDLYNIRYRTAAGGYVEDFEGITENGANPPEGWTMIDADGDGQNWFAWFPSQAGVEEVDNNGNATVLDHICMTSASWLSGGTILTPDNWLITPQVDLGGTLSLWYRGQDPSYANENFAVYVSVDGNTNTADFVELVPQTTAGATYAELTADLSEYEGMQGYIAIRHFNSSDVFRLNIDNFSIVMEGQEAGEWIYVENAEVPYTIEGLTPNTKYELQAQGIVEAKATTEWTKSVFFYTTEDEEQPAYYIVGTFNDWNQTAEGGRIEFVDNKAEGVVLEAEAEFKVITPAEEEGEWIWYGGADDNQVGYFLINNDLLGVNITLCDGANFRVEGAGTYNFELVWAKDGEVPMLKVTKEVTGIDSIAVDAKSNEWYNLNGQKLNGKPTTPGIYINGNKKVIIK